MFSIEIGLNRPAVRLALLGVLTAMLFAVSTLGPRSAAAQSPPCPDPAELTITTTGVSPNSDFKFEMSGKMQSGETCAKVTIPNDLAVKLANGSYPMDDRDDPNADPMGDMDVSGNVVTFTIRPDYIATHSGPYSFDGWLQVGVTKAIENGFQEYEIVLDLPGMSEPVKITVPGCPRCLLPPTGSYKWSSLDDDEGYIYSGVVLGTNLTSPTPPNTPPTTATLSDTLGPGQECTQAQLEDITDPLNHIKMQSVPCTLDANGKPFATVTFAPEKDHGYRLWVRSRITDTSLDSYSDTGRVEVEGRNPYEFEVETPWSAGGASGRGTNPPPPPPPPTTTTPGTPTTATTTTDTPDTPNPSTTPTTPTTPNTTTPDTPNTTNVSDPTPIGGASGAGGNAGVAGASVSGATANVSISKRADRMSYRPGQRVTYTIRVTTIGRSTARNLRICDPLPRGLTYASVRNGATIRNGTACRTISRLAPGRQAKMTIVARAQRIANAQQQIRNTATVRGSNLGRSRSASARVTVLRPAQLQRAGGVTG